jgi:hypothetical protein
MWTILILSLTVFLIILLILPIRLRINSDDEEFITGRYGPVRIGVKSDVENILAVILYILFFKITYYPLHSGERKTGKGISPLKSKPKKKLPQRSQVIFMIRIAWQTIKKSRVKKLYLDLDTSNVIVNASLFPFFGLINNNRNIDLNVNYAGNFSLILDIRNNLLNIIIIMIKNMLKR